MRRDRRAREPRPRAGTIGGPTRSGYTGAPVDLTIIIPALNEAGNIGPLITRCRATIAQLGVNAEILVVDGGSAMI